MSVALVSGHARAPVRAGIIPAVMASGESAQRIRTTLGDALADDEVLRSALPGKLYEMYDWYKRDEWEKLIWQVSERDVKTYLNCLP
jgi:glutamine synthetase